MRGSEHGFARAGGPARTENPAGLNRRGFLTAAGALLAAGHASQASARAPGPGPAQRDWSLHAGCALVARETGAGAKLERDVHLLIRDGRIDAIRPRPFRESVPHLDCSRELLLPGFISGHTHCCSATPTRGIIEGGRSYARPLELVESLSDDELDALTALNLAELIRSGCTTQVEMSLSHRQAESYARVAMRLGARGYPGSMIPAIDRLFPIWFRQDETVLADSQAGTLAEIQRSLDFGRRFMNAGGGLLRPMMSPHACDTHTEVTLKAIGAAARELGTGLHIHLSQGERETATVRRLQDRTPTQWLDSLGLLEVGPVFGAHMSGLDWSVDPAILRRRGVVYAHCPSAGGAGGATQPYPEALAAGIAVNIAIDTHSNDYLENLKLAVLFGQARHELTRSLGMDRATVAPTIRGAVDAATIVPARALQREDLGSIASGAQADLVSVDVSGPLVGSGALPPEPLNNLLYANGRMVRNVMTAGRLQVRDGIFIAADAERLLAEGGAVARNLWSRLADEGWFSAG
ncbi:MAG: amidohydrolase family protein [Halieaceae bacterium]|jgi:cytosine/adenosine deaminase-related metal-dependent hydrolase|nr:amidohydrolase family protein [Halieaceae bacterium]